MSACSIGAQAQSTDWSQQTSASGGGGLVNLIKAAQKEGVLDVPSPVDDTFDYDLMIRAFEARFGVKVTKVAGLGDAAQIGNPTALDVFNLAVDTATAHTNLFAPYLVFYWPEIPNALKDPGAHWYESCGGYITVVYDAGAVPPVASIVDLAKPGYTVAIDGDPRTSNEAVSAVVAAALGSGGAPGDVAPGVEFFGRLHESGQLTTEPAPVMIGWDYAVPGGTRLVPSPTVLGYQVQAVSLHALHPAAARLWEEFLFSDTGQNLCVSRKGRPSRLDAMRSDGVLDLGMASTLGPAPPSAIMLSPDQMAAARAYVTAHWAGATGQ
jgi:putative spermidine/putrescine transport system substrate-binding protein